MAAVEEEEEGVGFLFGELEGVVVAGGELAKGS